jgi:hypothetical protein
MRKEVKLKFFLRNNRKIHLCYKKERNYIAIVGKILGCEVSREKLL